MLLGGSLESVAALRSPLSRTEEGLEGFQKEMISELWLKGRAEAH